VKVFFKHFSEEYGSYLVQEVQKKTFGCGLDLVDVWNRYRRPVRRN